MTIPHLTLAIMASMLLAPAVSDAAPDDSGQPMRVIEHIPVGGSGGWDYLAIDGSHRHLFVSHGDRVVVVDLASQAVAGTIADTAGVHGIAFAPGLGEGFTSNGGANSVTVFDLASLKTLGTISGTGDNPDAILYEPDSGNLFTFNGRGHSASVIDPHKRSVVGTIALPGKPEFAQTDGAGHVYVNIENTSELIEIDAHKKKVMHRWSLAPCASPSGLALDNVHHRLFSVCDNGTMAVSDVQAGRVIAQVPIGKGPDAVVFDADSHAIVSSNGESGDLTVVRQDDANHYTVSETVPTRVGARTATLDPATQRIYLAVGKRTPGTDGHPMTEPGSFEVLVVGRH